MVMGSDEASIALTPAADGDAAGLADLRAAAMRESLERLGRFDRERARDRVLSGFSRAHTRHIVRGGLRVGFVVMKPIDGALLLDQLHVAPSHQGDGVGSAVLGRLFAEADAAGLPIRLSALRDSDANRFYVRHGFQCVGESEWDIHYVRPPAGKNG
jgi:GNAT superfamily N-acetyltransferase